MAEQFEFSFSARQIEAVTKALEKCGINSERKGAAFESFNDSGLVSAANAVHAMLRRKGQWQARFSSTPSLAREHSKETALSDLQKVNRSSKTDYMDLLSETSTLLAGAKAAQDLLSSEIMLRGNAQTALDRLDETLKGIRFSESDLSTKLDALTNAKER